ncbi:MAG: ATP-grasp domain-containing protein [Planctomycetaceae bacterium]|nr:ATP-grasp domain-containing protein [Planctomycetaceae bacterium]
MLPPAHVDPRPRLLIVGCSTRAAAWSAVRAGFRPVCADQFGDQDLHQVAEVLPVADYPAGLTRAFQATTASATIYVGAVENYRSIVSTIESYELYLGRLLGGDSQSLAILRDPRQLQLAASALGLPATEVRGTDFEMFSTFSHTLRRVTTGETPVDLPADGAWLRKPIRGGGGIGITLHTRTSSKRLLPTQDAVYFQKYVAGTSASALLLVRPEAVTCLGWMLQLIGDPVSAPPEPFCYCGSIGPIARPELDTEMLAAAVRKLVVGTRFAGLIGIDVIFADDGLHLIEVNPRYTASCELLELTAHRALLTDQWRAHFPEDCNPPPTPVPFSATRRRTSPMLGKLILYARKQAVAPDLSRLLQPRSPWSVPLVADIPRIGARFERGEPLCTVFAGGDSVEDVRRKLRRRADRVRRWFGDAE